MYCIYKPPPVLFVLFAVLPNRELDCDVCVFEPKSDPPLDPPNVELDPNPADPNPDF